MCCQPNNNRKREPLHSCRWVKRSRYGKAAYRMTANPTFCKEQHQIRVGSLASPLVRLMPLSSAQATAGIVVSESGSYHLGTKAPQSAGPFFGQITQTKGILTGFYHFEMTRIF